MYRFDKLKEIEKEYEDFDAFKGFDIREKMNNPKNIAYSPRKYSAAKKSYRSKKSKS